MPPFRLVPFLSEPLVLGLQIGGSVERAGTSVHATYVLSGDRADLVIPAPAPQPARRDELWRATCLELFIAARGQPQYLEVNCSPSGDWNAYSFTGYREGMKPLPVARFFSRCAAPHDDTLELHFDLEFESDFPVAALSDVAVTAVLEHKSGARSYWALVHTSDRPDFHRRDSFLLPLPVG